MTNNRSQSHETLNQLAKPVGGPPVRLVALFRQGEIPCNRFETILFAADFSDNSKEAFRAACSLAVENQTRLVVLHVAETHHGLAGAGVLRAADCPVLTGRSRQGSS